MAEETKQQKEFDFVEMDKAFKNGGMTGLANMLKRKIDNWKDEEINIAVIGSTGVGKSCFINAVMGNMNESQPGYAPVGQFECSMKIYPYPHPNNKHLIFWELPSPGTKSFPRKIYVKNKKIQFHSHDIFIIMTCDRFTEDEIWLASEIERLGKKFLFVRSKIDCQINSDKVLKKRANKIHDPQAVIDEIRIDYRKNLGDNHRDIYLINNTDICQNDLDFQKLLDLLVVGFDELKAEAFLNSIHFFAKTLTDRENRSFRRTFHGNLSRVLGCAYIPEISLKLDDLLKEIETCLYCKQVRLSENNSKVYAGRTEMPEDVADEKYTLESTSLPSGAKAVLGPDALTTSDALLDLSLTHYLYFS